VVRERLLLEGRNLPPRHKGASRTTVRVIIHTTANQSRLQDLVETTRALETYREIDPAFASTREHQLLVDLLQAVESGDQEGFADKLFQFDQLSKLDKWKTTLLLRIKNNIEEAEEDFS
jgi:hypothetical protein